MKTKMQLKGWSREKEEKKYNLGIDNSSNIQKYAH